ncbi:MAG: hypothetical protein FWG35_00260 [Spirochaetaceae bacterium]|nr:hypothetical protein [Spirochaetaceae bacterium]
MKRCLFLRACALCAGLSVSLPGAARAQHLLGEEPVSVEVSSAAGKPGYWDSRVLAGWDDYRFVYVALRDYERPDRDYTAAGFSASWIAAGPLSPGGLFREVFSPLGYTAGSSVFAETSRLSLNTARAKSPRKGIWISVPGDYAAVGAYTDGDDITHTAATVNFFRGKRGPLLSGLFMVSEPPSRLGSDVWFPDKPLFGGGKLYHAGLRGQIPFDSLTGGITRVGISGAFSFGQRADTAKFYHLFAAHTDKTMDIRLLQGVADEGYLTPAGRYPSYRVVRSASLKLFPRGPVIPYASAAQTVYQVYRPQTAERPERLRLSGGTEYKTKRLSIKLEGSRKTETDTAGRDSDAESMRGVFSWKSGRAKFTADCGANWENAVLTSRRITLSAGASPKGWDFSARLKGEWKPDLVLSGKLSAALDNPGLRFGFSAELAKPLAPRHSSLRTINESPWDYLVVSVFIRSRMDF